MTMQKGSMVYDRDGDLCRIISMSRSRADVKLIECLCESLHTPGLEWGINLNELKPYFPTIEESVLP